MRGVGGIHLLRHPIFLSSPRLPLPLFPTQPPHSFLLGVNRPSKYLLFIFFSLTWTSRAKKAVNYKSLQPWRPVQTDSFLSSAWKDQVIHMLSTRFESQIPDITLPDKEIPEEDLYRYTRCRWL